MNLNLINLILMKKKRGRWGEKGERRRDEGTMGRKGKRKIGGGAEMIPIPIAIGTIRTA